MRGLGVCDKPRILLEEGGHSEGTHVGDKQRGKESHSKRSHRMAAALASGDG